MAISVSLSEKDRQKGQRVLMLRNYLKLTQTEFGQKLTRLGKAVSQNYLSAIESGRQRLGDDVQTRIEASFNVRHAWLEEGIGDMFHADQPDLTPEQQQRVKAVLDNMPAIRARGGNLTWVPVRERGLFLRTDGESMGLKRSVLPILSEAAWAFEVSDGMMLPAYAPGSWIICTRLESFRDLVVGSNYGIQTPDQIMLARFDGYTDTKLHLSYTTSTVPFDLETDLLQHAYHIEYKLAKP